VGATAARIADLAGLPGCVQPVSFCLGALSEAERVSPRVYPGVVALTVRSD